MHYWIEISIASATLAFLWSAYITSPKGMLSCISDYLAYKNAPRWVHKILYSCPVCISMQLALWLNLLPALFFSCNVFNPLHLALSVGVSGCLVHLLDNYGYDKQDY